MSNKGSKLPLRQPGRKVNAKKVNKSGTTSDRQESSTAGDEDSATTVSKAPYGKVKKASPYDKDFREQVLTPRGILIVVDWKELCKSVWEHFETVGPDKDPREFYKQKGSEHSNVWLDADQVYLSQRVPETEIADPLFQAFVERVAEEYGCMKSDSVCEAQYAMYAMVNLFRQDRLTSQRQRDQRGWKSDFKVQLVAKPGVPWWEAPPILTTEQGLKQYDFDIRPDCGYWLSLDACRVCQMCSDTPSIHDP